MAREFWLCFVPLFVAVDALGVLPLFMGLTDGLDRQAVRRIVLESVATATAVALLFVAIGKALLSFVGVSVADFLIAGGAVLFIIAVRDLLTLQKVQRQVEPAELGPVPIGVPLIVGPAVLTTTLILAGQYGYGWTAAALMANIAIAGAVFWFSTSIRSLLGSSGSRAISKLSSLLLAAIAVMMVRRGLSALLDAPTP